MTFKTQVLAAAAAAALAPAAQAALVYGLVDGGNLGAGTALTTFDTASPAVRTAPVPITGATDIRAIDVRPADGRLYALGYTPQGSLTRMYTINPATGVATPVGPTLVVPALSITNRVSMDFNPVVDRLRVVSATGGNLRMNPNDGTVTAVDTALAYAPGQAQTGTPLISGVAYTNNVPGATSTTLYATDFFYDSLTTIGGVNGTPSPNGGQVFNIGFTEPPATQFDAGVGFDIAGGTGIAYVSLNDADSASADSEFYRVDLATGALLLVDDEIGIDLLDISVVAVPEPAALLGVAAVGAGLALRAGRRKK